jgi:hypothetical protein
LRVKGSGLRVAGLGLRVEQRIERAGAKLYKVQDSGFRVWVQGFIGAKNRTVPSLPYLIIYMWIYGGAYTVRATTGMEAGGEKSKI